MELVWNGMMLTKPDRNLAPDGDISRRPTVELGEAAADKDKVRFSAGESSLLLLLMVGTAEAKNRAL